MEGKQAKQDEKNGDDEHQQEDDDNGAAHDAQMRVDLLVLYH